MSRGKERPPDDPLMQEMSRLAKEYGDTEILRVSLLVIQKYADLGARQALTKRQGNPEIACQKCREQEAAAKQLQATLNRCKTTRPIGGGAPSQSEEE